MPSPAGMRRHSCAKRDTPLSSGLISTTRAPASRARNGSDAAGCTSPDVPTTTSRPQPSTMRSARPRVFGKGLAEPDHAGPEGTAAALAGRRCFPRSGVRRLQRREDRILVQRRAAIQAAGREQLPVQMHHGARARALVQVVDVLGDHLHRVARAGERGDAGMPGVWLRAADHRGAPAIPAPDQRGIAAERGFGREVRRIVARPQPGRRVAEGRDAA